MVNVTKASIALAGVLFFSSYTWSQTREPNKPIRADGGKTLVDQYNKNGTGGPAPRHDIGSPARYKRVLGRPCQPERESSASHDRLGRGAIQGP